MTVIWLVRLLLIAAVLLATAIELIHASPFVGVIVGVVSLSAAACSVAGMFRRISAGMTLCCKTARCM